MADGFVAGRVNHILQVGLQGDRAEGVGIGQFQRRFRTPQGRARVDGVGAGLVAEPGLVGAGRQGAIGAALEDLLDQYPGLPAPGKVGGVAVRKARRAKATARRGPSVRTSSGCSASR